MERELPVLKIEGTDFIVEVAGLQLREKANAENTIHLFDMRDVGDGYVFDYSPKEKNIPSSWQGQSEHSTVKIPELVQLDPIGMAEKYGYSIQEIQGKTDLELMVDQQALATRLKGQLPTVEIAGHTFFVDIRMDMLRPKDDFLSKGIVFSQIEDYYHEGQQSYTIPYNQKLHEFQELDLANITIMPKDLLLVSFPHESNLDPVGYNRKGGWDETDGLKEKGLKPHVLAKVLDWKEIGIDEIIKKNIENKKQQLPNQGKRKPKNSKGKRRGPKL